MDPTPINEDWVEIVPGCTVSIEVDPNAANEEQHLGIVTHANITTAGTIYLVDMDSGKRLDAYRLTYAPSETETLGLRYLAPAAAGVSRAFTIPPQAITSEEDVTAYFQAAHDMEVAFVVIFGPPA